MEFQSLNTLIVPTHRALPAKIINTLLFDVGYPLFCGLIFVLPVFRSVPGPLPPLASCFLADGFHVISGFLIHAGFTRTSYPTLVWVIFAYGFNCATGVAFFLSVNNFVFRCKWHYSTPINIYNSTYSNQSQSETGGM